MRAVRKAQYGIGMGTTIMVAALLAVLTFAFSGLSITNLGLLKHEENAMIAENLARSVVAQAIEKIVAEPEFGVERPGVVLEIHQPSAPDTSYGYLAFDTEQARAREVRYSTNNIQGTVAVNGDAESVPAQAVHLVGVGQCGNVRRTAEVVLTVPPYPYALAAAGTIRAEGGLTVSSVEAYPEGPVIPDEQLRPADLVSNSTAEEAIFLSANTRVGGDVRAVGHVVLDPDAPADSIEIQGEIQSFAGEAAIPDFELSDFDPLERAHETLVRDSYSQDTTLSGAVRRDGDLTINGELELDNGLLYVDGDLTVNGNLTGTGILAVSGNVSVRAGTDFRGESKLAILSAADVRLQGSGPQGSYVQGLVWTKGNFSADQVTVAGHLVATGSEAEVTLKDSRIVSSPGAEVVTVAVAGTSGTSSTISIDWADIADLYDPNDHSPMPTPPQGQPPFEADIQALDDGNYLYGGQTLDLGRLRMEVFIDLQRYFFGHLDLGLGDEFRSLDFRLFTNELDRLLAAQSGSVPETETTEGQEAAIYTVDPSQVLELADRIRVAQWLEH